MNRNPRDERKKRKRDERQITTDKIGETRAEKPKKTKDKKQRSEIDNQI